MNTHGLLFALVATLTSLLSLNFTTSQALAKAKTFVYCSEGSPSSFGPALVTDGPSVNASSVPVYDRLVEFRDGETTLRPGLAASWTISKDNKKYNFKLRKDIKFHQTKTFKPTRNFNADDVLFTFNRMRLKNHPYYKVGGGIYEYFHGMDMHNIIKDIKKINDHEVEFVLNHPEAPFVANLAMSFASIYSKEYADQLKKQNKQHNIDHKPVGTGPFILTRYVKDTLIRYKANPNYYRGKAKIDRLVISITPSPSVRFQKLKKGECHFAAHPAPADLSLMKKNSNITVLQAPGMNIGYLAMNVKKKPYDNVLVRQAINYALNKKSYIKAIYLGHAEIAKNPIPPSLWSYNNKVKDYDYNPQKAKELLKKAGYPKGFSTELWTLPISRPYNPNGKKMGEMMQADLLKVGIKVKLVSYDWPTYLSKSKNGEHQMLQLGWTGDNGDPDNFLHTLLGCAAVGQGSNFARWCHKKYNKIILEAKRSTNLKSRTKKYQMAQEIFKKEAPWVTLVHSLSARAMRNNVQGYVMDPNGLDNFYGVSFKKKLTR